MKLQSELKNPNTLSTRVIGADEYHRFIKFYNALDEVSVTEAYLNACDAIRVFYYNEDEWLAGYALNTEASPRYFEPFTEKQKKTILKDKKILESRILEITCLKIDYRLLATSERERLRIYNNLFQDIFAVTEQECYIIVGSKIPGIWKSFQQIIPQELYFGIISFSNGEEELCKILFEKRSKVLANYLKYLAFK